jgi:hypothetical protein
VEADGGVPAVHEVADGLRKAYRLLTKQAASDVPPGITEALSAVEEAPEGAKLWCGAATVLFWLGGWRGRLCWQSRRPSGDKTPRYSVVAASPCLPVCVG